MIILRRICLWLNEKKQLLMDIDWNEIYDRYFKCCNKNNRQLKCCKKRKNKIDNSDIQMKRIKNNGSKPVQVNNNNQVLQKQVNNYEELLETIKLEDSDSTDSSDETIINTKFMENLEYNFNVLKNLQSGYKLKIDFNEQKLSEENGYIAFISRKFTGQNKQVTLDFIKKMIESMEIKYNNRKLLKTSVKGLKNLRDTYVSKTWYGEHMIVTELNKIIEKIED